MASRTRRDGRVLSDAYTRAVGMRDERRCRLDAALAEARERPDAVDVVDIADLALAVDAADTLVQRLETAMERRSDAPRGG